MRTSVTNLYALKNQDELAVPYRLVSIGGLTRGPQYQANLNRLVKVARYELKRPAALLSRGEEHMLAIPQDARAVPNEIQLTPEVATLAETGENGILRFASLTPEMTPLALAYLEHAFRGPVMFDRALWGGPRTYYEKRAVSVTTQIDRYSGFSWRVVERDGRLYLALDVTLRHVDSRWLSERTDGSDSAAFMRRRLLYHYGNNWYVVQLEGISHLSVSEQKFVPAGERDAVDVYSWTKDHNRDADVPWLRDLDPSGRAIQYRYPGNEQVRFGALALGKLVLSTRDLAEAGVRQGSSLDPAPRFARLGEIVGRHFVHATLEGQRLVVEVAPLRVPYRGFNVPPQRFAAGRVLAVPGTPDVEPTDVAPLDRFGRKRGDLLREVGPLDTRPFDAQHLILPLSLPRAINEDFRRRFSDEMGQLAQRTYAPRLVLYDDRGAHSLHKLTQAIFTALDAARVDRGYALLVLPAGAPHDLHDYAKRKLWNRVKLQCASAARIASFYRRDESGQLWPDAERKYAPYLRHCALGMLMVNRIWPWALGRPLHYAAHVGIDVLNATSGVTATYAEASKITFRSYPGRHHEQLTATQLRHIFANDIAEDLRGLAERPRSLIVQRDGRVSPRELEGMRSGVAELQRQNLLPLDVTFGVVEVRKSDADHLRLVEDGGQSLRNPVIGTYDLWSRSEGIVCTTGWPYLTQGTAAPLAVRIVEGDIDLAHVLEDIFDLSQLVFGAPDRCMRLPITIKLGDELLRPIAASIEEHDMLYDDEDVPEALEEDAPTPADA